MNASLTLACLIAAGVGTVVQNTLMVRITQSASTILIAMLLNSLVGIVIFVTMLLLRQGVAGFQELALSVKWWTLIPGLLGSFSSSPASAVIKTLARRRPLRYWWPASWWAG